METAMADGRPLQTSALPLYESECEVRAQIVKECGPKVMKFKIHQVAAMDPNLQYGHQSQGLIYPPPAASEPGVSSCARVEPMRLMSSLSYTPRLCVQEALRRPG